jgi:tripartite-type tricarboxylate transporter receptor subunit TctC
MLNRRDFGALVGLAGAAAVLPGRAYAAPEAYPHRTVTLLTHSSPGGGSDVFLREMTRHLVKHLSATFVVENVTGGSGARALSRLATSRPDGSVFYATTPTYIYTSLLSRPPHTFRDVQPLANVFTDAEVVYVRTENPARTLQDLMAQARARRGRWGAANPASLERQAAERLRRAANVQAAVVSHEGGGDLMINVLNGTLDLGIGEIQEIRSQLDANRVRLLATFNPQRLTGYPDVPTVREAGFDVVLRKFRGLAGPNGLPAEIVAVWERVIPRLLDDPEYKTLYQAENLAPDFIAQQQYAAFITEFARESETFFRENGVTGGG